MRAPLHLYLAERGKEGGGRKGREWVRWFRTLRASARACVRAYVRFATRRRTSLRDRRHAGTCTHTRFDARTRKPGRCIHGRFLHARRGGEGRVSGFVAFIIRHSVRRLNLGQCGKKATRTSWASWQRGEEGREREGERERSATKREKEGSESEVCVCVCVRVSLCTRARECACTSRVRIRCRTVRRVDFFLFFLFFFLFSFLFRTRHLASSSIFFPPFSLGSTSTLSTFRFHGTGKEGERKVIKKFGCEARKKSERRRGRASKCQKARLKLSSLRWRKRGGGGESERGRKGRERESEREGEGERERKGRKQEVEGPWDRWGRLVSPVSRV